MFVCFTFVSGKLNAYAITLLVARRAVPFSERVSCHHHVYRMQNNKYGTYKVKTAFARPYRCVLKIYAVPLSPATFPPSFYRSNPLNAFELYDFWDFFE